MSSKKTYKHVSYLFDDAKLPADPVGQLVQRSNWLGADLRLTNFAGGNTSVKCTETDPLTGEKVKVMWIKGSGGDLGSMKKDGLASLYLDKFYSLEKKYRGLQHEDEMVDYLSHCTFNLNPRAASIDTPLHAFLPPAHVDHLHPDAVIAIAASKDGEAITKKIYGGKVAWIPWQRPGFELGLKLREAYNKTKGLEGIVLGGHGLFAWGETAKESYEKTLELIETAAQYLEDQAKGKKVFGGPVRDSLPEAERRTQAIAIMPLLRGLASSAKPMLGHFRDDAVVQEFLNSKDLKKLAAEGTSCPDHFLRTKRVPLVLDIDPKANLTDKELIEKLKGQFAAYREEYKGYHERNKLPDSPAVRDPNPVIILWPGIGMFSFAKDKATARIAAEFYVNAINVIRGAETISSYVSIGEKESFNIEYWALEENKLKRMPKEQPCSRRVAIVTGSGSGIGKSIAERFLREGANVMIADLKIEAANMVRDEFAKFAGERVSSCVIDVGNNESIEKALEATVLAFGGVDLVVNNAGLSISKPLAETTEKDWDIQFNVMVKGSFLVSRASAKVFAAQGTAVGGDVIYIISKNAVMAQPNNIAYGSAKAAQLHQMHLLACELAAFGVRVNAIHPDAVVKGSGIFASGWGADRAKAYGIKEEELGSFYAKRTLLNREILPEDMANAAFVLVGGELSKTTGMVIPVDGGLAAAFLR